MLRAPYSWHEHVTVLHGIPAVKIVKVSFRNCRWNANIYVLWLQAANVVLLDDDFASLVAAITEGRVLYDNLKKTIAYTLSHIPPETFPVILSLALGMPLGLGSLLVLSIDLFTEQVRATFLFCLLFLSFCQL